MRRLARAMHELFGWRNHTQTVKVIGKFDPKDFVSKLESNAKKYAQFHSALDSIFRKTDDHEFVKYLRSVGLEGLREIKAIDSLSEDDLMKYLDLHYKKQKVVLLMDNERILDQAIELLKGLDLSNAESVQINNTKIDDGSSLFEVGVSYPATVEVNDEIQTKDGAIASISLDHKDANVKDVTMSDITNLDEMLGFILRYAYENEGESLSYRDIDLMLSAKMMFFESKGLIK